MRELPYTLLVGSSRPLFSLSRLRLAGKAPRVFPHELLDRVDLRGLPSDDPLHLRVLGLKFFEP